MRKSDSYLSHAFTVIGKERSRREGVDDTSQFPIALGGNTRGGESAANRLTTLLPMLVRVSDPAWNPSNMPDWAEKSRIGNIISCLGSLRTIDALEADPSVLSIEASRRAAGSDVSKSIPLIKSDVVCHPPLAETGDKALVAIIDSGVDVLHKAFQDGNAKTRFLEIWDQTDSTGPGPIVSGLSSYGTIHTQVDINDYIINSAVPAGLGRDLDGHGTHVTSIAVGKAVSPFAGGVAPDSKIIAVIPNLQTGTDDPFSLGYSTSHVDALVYIKAFAKKANMPVIVNVSQGMNAGAHDGTSLLESAFDEFSGNGREPGFIIVKSAGNERGFKGHAELTLLNGQTEFLKWNSAHPHIGPDVVELWFKACDKFNFVLRNPAGKPSKLVSCTYNEETGSFPSGNGFQMSYVRYHQDNGDSRLLVTIWPKFKASIESGTWTLEVQGASVIDGELHAWIERDDSRSINFTDHISDKTTLSIPGTAGTVISVGAVAASKPFSLANYSSYGPTRDSREKPDLAAPGEQIIAARGGTVDGIKTMSGTSMAAPHVTGAIALLFSYLVNQGRSVPNAAQVRAAISQMTQNYNGRHNPGMGFGVLDVENLINAFL